MKKALCFIKWIVCGIIGALILTGCASQRGTEKEPMFLETEKMNRTETAGTEDSQELETNKEVFLNETAAESKADESETDKETAVEPETAEVDWSGYFDGFNGAAVVYDVSAGRFTIYNRELASTRRSPCSTFKIVSSLIALETGIIEPDDSVREWSGEVFWNEAWNQDLGFDGAFRESCVWYFREIVDAIGAKRMQEELDRLNYGNADISDWEGRLNTNNSNRALTGFWIESSLAISPIEQTEVMERIFGENSVYSEETKSELKKVMLVDEQEEAGFSIYGKTGMGKAEGVVVDAWFVGFARRADKTVYFCVYLGRTADKNSSSAAAREIAFRLVADYWKETDR